MNKRRALFQREAAEFDRGLGFFDALYGFAITLLIANVDIPPAAAWTSVSSLLDHGLGAQLMGFVISFVVIAVFWKVNAELLAGFKALDGPIIAANLVTSALIVALPFTTQAISDPEVREYPLAVTVYALNVSLAMISQSVMYWIGSRRGLLITELSRAGTIAGYLDVAARVAVFLVSIPVAYLVNTDWAQLTWLLLIVVGPVMGVWSARVEARSKTFH